MSTKMFSVRSIPFLIFESLSRIEGYLKEFHYRSISTISPKAKILATGRVVNLQKSRNSIIIGNSTFVRGELLVFPDGGCISLGKWCYVGEGSRVWSAAGVTVGDRVLISHNVNIHDTNGHPTDSELRHQHFREIATIGHPDKDFNVISRPIIIEDDVWIGFNSTILKGVTVGRGAIVGACSVVAEDVPSGAIVVGNPARVIRNVGQI